MVDGEQFIECDVLAGLERGAVFQQQPASALDDMASRSVGPQLVARSTRTRSITSRPYLAITWNRSFWTDFLRSLTRRGLRGVKLVISDAHEGLKAAAAKVLQSTWQRCRVHFLRNVLAHAGKGQRQVVMALINTVFAQDTQEAAIAQWRTVTDQLRVKFPKLAAVMDEAEADVLAFMGFPKSHRVQIHSTNPLERLNAEIKRRTNVVGIFPSEPAITRLVGALLLEQNDEWQLQRRYLPLEGLQALADNQPARLSAVVS